MESLVSLIGMVFPLISLNLTIDFVSDGVSNTLPVRDVLNLNIVLPVMIMTLEESSLIMIVFGVLFFRVNNSVYYPRAFDGL